MTLALLAAAVLGFPTSSFADVIAMSDFTVDDECWLIAGDATSAIPTHMLMGGNPDGFLRGFDQTVGNTWYWDAPSKFLGNVGAAYGFALTFELRMRGSGPLFDESDVILDGAGLSLHLAVISPVPEDLDWTSYEAGLTESTGWRVGSLAGDFATADQLRFVLSDLRRLRIRGEFISGADNGDLDNVVLEGYRSAVPEPGSLTLLGLGGATLLGLFHRRGRRAGLRPAVAATNADVTATTDA
jgi:hypothetical protein